MGVLNPSFLLHRKYNKISLLVILSLFHHKKFNLILTHELFYLNFLGLLFHFLDELLFLFSAEPYLICKKLRIDEFNMEEFRIKCTCFGEPFDLKKHPQGTEVKAITYSAMQIVQNPVKYEIFVIIDIWESLIKKIFDKKN